MTRTVGNMATLYGILLSANVHAQETLRENLENRLARFYSPPEEFEDELGEYRSPLMLASGQRMKSKEQWRERRAELLKMWHRRLGEWPPLVEKPTMKRLVLSLIDEGIT